MTNWAWIIDKLRIEWPSSKDGQVAGGYLSTVLYSWLINMVFIIPDWINLHVSLISCPGKRLTDFEKTSKAIWLFVLRFSSWWFIASSSMYTYLVSRFWMLNAEWCCLSTVLWHQTSIDLHEFSLLLAMPQRLIHAECGWFNQWYVYSLI